jgi:hypothetical protein
MIYQVGGSEFNIKPATDISGLEIKAEPGPKGDRHQLTISLNPRVELKPGVIHGSLFIETNDPEFPRLSVPVSGGILDR